MRKLVSIVFAILISQPAHSYDAENIRSFLKKQKKCVFATYEVMIGKDTRNMFAQRYYVRCIGDVTTAPNTIKEKRGCGAFGFNTDDDSIEDLTSFGFNIAEGKSCDSGGFEQVLNDFLYTDSTGIKPRKVYVRDYFRYFTESSIPQAYYRLVVFSSKDSYRSSLGYPKDDIDLAKLDYAKKKKTSK